MIPNSWALLDLVLTDAGIPLQEGSKPPETRGCEHRCSGITSGAQADDPRRCWPWPNAAFGGHKALNPLGGFEVYYAQHADRGLSTFWWKNERF